MGVERLDEIDLGGHEDEFVEAAVFEMDFAEPGENREVAQAGLLLDFAASGHFGGFAGLDVAFGDGPALFGILDEQNLDVFLVAGKTKNNAARGWLADNLLNRRFFAKNSRFKFGEGGFFDGVSRQSFRYL